MDVKDFEVIRCRPGEVEDTLLDFRGDGLQGVGERVQVLSFAFGSTHGLHKRTTKILKSLRTDFSCRRPERRVSVPEFRYSETSEQY